MREFKTVIYYEEKNDLEDLGIETGSEKEERLSRIALDLSKVISFRETFMEYQNEWRDSVVVYLEGGGELPPLLINYDKFKKVVESYEK